MTKSRNIRRIYRKLVNHPFFPMLFISEVVKVAATGGLSDPNLVPLTTLAVISTVMWILSDDVEDAVETITDEE